MHDDAWEFKRSRARIGKCRASGARSREFKQHESAYDTINYIPRQMTKIYTHEVGGRGNALAVVSCARDFWGDLDSSLSLRCVCSLNRAKYESCFFFLFFFALFAYRNNNFSRNTRHTAESLKHPRKMFFYFFIFYQLRIKKGKNKTFACDEYCVCSCNSCNTYICYILSNNIFNKKKKKITLALFTYTSTKECWKYAPHFLCAIISLLAINW